MNVYPVNLVPGAELISNVISYSNISNIYHRYLKHRAYFSNDETQPYIVMKWAEPIDADSIIVGDTNCLAVTVKIVYENGSSDEVHITLNSKLVIRDVLKKEIKEITFNFLKPTYNIQPYIGFIFVGNKIELPRFTVQPNWETIIRGDSNRTNNGQAYGTVLPTLDKLSTSYIRITDDEKKIVDDYIQSVQTSIPHVVDLYPEAHEAVPPKYATLTKGVAYTKRAESNFFWNYDMEWLEAR